MSIQPYDIRWELETVEELEDAGLSPRLRALLISIDQSSQQQVGRWIGLIPLQWIRDPDHRYGFWEMAADDLNKLPIGPKDREELTAKLARVVEPLTETEAQAAAERYAENDELRNAFSREFELARRFKAKPTQELKIQLRESQSYTNYAWQRDHEKRKRRYQEETSGP